VDELMSTEFINPSANQLEPYVSGLLARAEASSPSEKDKLLEGFYATVSNSSWVDHYENVPLDTNPVLTIDAIVLGNGVMVRNFELRILARFVHEGYTYLSNGYQAFSPRKFEEDMSEALSIAVFLRSV
jgi:hypothetical protein